VDQGDLQRLQGVLLVLDESNQLLVLLLDVGLEVGQRDSGVDLIILSMLHLIGNGALEGVQKLEDLLLESGPILLGSSVETLQIDSLSVVIDVLSSDLVTGSESLGLVGFNVEGRSVNV